MVQAGSLRAAARTVGVSQPAISKSLRQLEAELRVALLQRNARGAVPTPAGKAFLARARVVHAELRKASEDLQSYQGGTQGRVAFGVAPQHCMLLVPQAMRDFRRRYPDAPVRIIEGVTTALAPLVRDETLDFAIGMNPGLAGSDLKFKPLLRPQLVVVGRLGHRLGSARSLAELSEARWLMYYPVGVGAMLEKAFADAGAPMPRGIVQCESFATALGLMANTDTLGLLIPEILAEPFGRAHLQRIPVRETLPAPLVGLYSRKDAPLTAAAAAMAQCITSAARRVAGER